MPIMKSLARLMYGAVLATLAGMNQACAVDTAAVITLKTDGTIIAKDGDGKDFIRCVLCPPKHSHKYGHNCEELAKAGEKERMRVLKTNLPLCKRLNNFALNDTITILRGGTNPDCNYISTRAGDILLNPGCKH